MGKGRLEAFSDGVIAIIITIMVLELKTPSGSNFSDLLALGPTFLGYVLSFAYVAIYWNNHHHLFQLAHHVTGRILWSNIHLLFWLSLIPFVTSWSDQSDFSPIPVALYGMVLLMAAIAYYLLARSLIAHHGRESLLAVALGKDIKGKLSVVGYAVAIPIAFWMPGVSLGIYALLALVWIVPDSRIEKLIRQDDHH